MGAQFKVQLEGLFSMVSIRSDKAANTAGRYRERQRIDNIHKANHLPSKKPPNDMNRRSTVLSPSCEVSLISGY